MRRHCSVVEEHEDEDNSGDDEAVDIDEVPDASNADGVPVTRRGNERRDIAGIVFRRPEAVAGHFERREADPFASRRAVVIEIQPRMIHQDRQAAANQQHHEKEIEEVAIAHPERKSVRTCEVVGDIPGRTAGICGRPARANSIQAARTAHRTVRRFRSEWMGEPKCESGGPSGSGQLYVRHRSES